MTAKIPSVQMFNSPQPVARRADTSDNNRTTPTASSTANGNRSLEGPLGPLKISDTSAQVTPAKQSSTPTPPRQFEISVVELKPELHGTEAMDEGCKGCSACNVTCNSCKSCSCNAGPELSRAPQPGEVGFSRFRWAEIDA